MAAQLRDRITWMFRRSSSPAERQMASFRATQEALARASEANRPAAA